MARLLAGGLLFVLAVVGGIWLTGSSSPLRAGGVSAVESWAPQITAAAAEAGLPSPYLLAGLVYAESRGRADAVSSVGAIGLCQLMPPTAAEVAQKLGIDGPPYAPKDNLRMGAAYLAQMLRRHQGDVDLALLSYRMGPGRVAREIRKAGSTAAFLTALKARQPSPWGYRDQVIEFRDHFARRAAAGKGGWQTSTL